MKRTIRLLVLAPLAWVCTSMSPAAASSGELANMALNHDGLERTYLLYRPAGIDRTHRRPLLLVLHGGGGTARGMVRITKNRFNELADQQGFYVVYPQGIDKSWNEGRKDPIAGAHRRGIDDLGFFKALIGQLTSNHPVDSARIFVTGISNGGMMALRLGCSLPEKILAIAPIAASIPTDISNLCQSPASVSVVLFNGTDDPLVPYDGGQVKVFRQERGEVIGTDRTIDLWRTKNGCSASAITRELPDEADDGTRVTRIEYARCAMGTKVVLYKVEGGGHTWPGGQQYLPERMIGRTNRDINAADEMWKVFRDLGSTSGN